MTEMLQAETDFSEFVCGVLPGTLSPNSVWFPKPSLYGAVSFALAASLLPTL